MPDRTLPPPGPEEDDRLRALAPLLSGVVHDLRNPLSVIRTNLYLLRRQVEEGDPRTLRALERIEDQVSAAARMLEELAALYRVEHPHPQLVLLGETVREAAEQAAGAERGRLHVAADGSPRARVDPQLLQAAVRALVRNAVEFSRETPIRVTVSRADGRAVVEVADEGPGADPALLERIGEPFLTTRPDHAGLGLWLAARVAAVHEGTLEVSGGQGFTARLTLPGPQSPGEQEPPRGQDQTAPEQ